VLNFKRRYFSLGVLFLGLAAGSWSWAAQEAIVSAEEAAIRERPTTDAKVIESLPSGATLKVSSRQKDGWYKARASTGQIGWVSQDDITLKQYSTELKQGNVVLKPQLAHERREYPQDPVTFDLLFKVYFGINSTTALLNGPPVGGLNFSGTYSGQTNPALGFGLDFGFSRYFSAELDALYTQRSFGGTLDAAGDAFTQSQKTVEFPVLVRFHPHSLFSVGGGMYYALYPGNINGTLTTFGKTKVVNASYQDSSQNQADFGFVVSAAVDIPVPFRVPIFSEVGLVVDARYLIGWENNSLINTTSLKFREFMILGGLRFGARPSGSASSY
jgi:hypothetical protein